MAKQKSTRAVEVRVLVDCYIGGVRARCNDVLELPADVVEQLVADGLVDANPAAVAAAQAQTSA